METTKVPANNFVMLLTVKTISFCCWHYYHTIPVLDNGRVRPYSLDDDVNNPSM